VIEHFHGLTWFGGFKIETRQTTSFAYEEQPGKMFPPIRKPLNRVCNLSGLSYITVHREFPITRAAPVAGELRVVLRNIGRRVLWRARRLSINRKTLQAIMTEAILKGLQLYAHNVCYI
jgi:hypothetical protein